MERMELRKVLDPSLPTKVVGKEGGVGAMESLDAAEWAWRALWCPGQKEKFANLRILESIIFEDKAISKWLFTSVNTQVKSRKKGSWTLASLMETCRDPGKVSGKSKADDETTMPLNAHYFAPARLTKKGKDGRKIPPKPAEWLTLESGECSKILGGGIAAHAIIGFAHISGPIAFAEITIETKVGSKEVNPTPKIVTHMLYSGSRIDVSGSALTTNEKLEKQEELNKLGLPPQKLTCLNKTVTFATSQYIVKLKKELEARTSTIIRRLVAVVLLETTADEKKAAWLHHVKYVDFMPNPMQDKPIDEDWQERRSNAASEISSGSNSWHRITKCMGDFCQYPLDVDEAHDMMDNADTNGNFKLELRKARERHRKGGDSSRSLEDSGDMLSSDSRRADDGAPLADEGEQKRLGRKVPFKSIALCRQESESWEILGRTHTYDHTTMPWSETLYAWWFRVGKGLATNGSGAGVPISGAHSIGKAMLGMNPIPEADAEEGIIDSSNSPLKHLSPDGKKPVSLSELSGPLSAHQVTKDDNGEAVFDLAAGKVIPGKEIHYDLHDNKYSGHKRRSVGQMSWYYSEANVCQTCYYTYRDIDRRRKSMQSKSLKAMRKHVALTSGKAGAEYDREIEKKIFDQRKMASRLSAPKQNPSIDSSSNMLRSGTSPSLNSNPFRGGKSKAPSGSLPPLPWQLRDEEIAREYLEPNKFNSAIVRNIRGKAQGMAQLVQQDRMTQKVEAKKKRMMRGGMLDDNSQLLEEATASAEAEWQEFIGQSRAEFEQKKAATRNARKVTGGLGENRPKPRSKDFDPNRLKHQWQRDADELARKVRGFEGNTSEKNNPEYTGLAEPIKDSSLAMNNTWNRRGGKKKGKENMIEQPRVSVDKSLAQGSLAQGSMVSQLTMEPSMAALGNQPGPGVGQSSLSSLDGLDDEDWIRAVMVSGKGSNVNLAELSYSSNRSGAKTPNKRNMNVSFQEPSKNDDDARRFQKNEPTRAYMAANNSDDDDDDDDDEGVGWSPFVIPGQ